MIGVVYVQHEMKLESYFFNCLKNGTKRIEIRLNDEKRKIVKIGDIIRFREVTNEINYIDVCVEELLYFDNFEDLVNYFDISVIADKTYSKDKLLDTLEKMYSKEQQEKYKVVGIKLNLK